MKLAEACGTDVSYIGQIEMGKRFPSIKLIEKIAIVLGVEPYRLFMNDSGLQYGEINETEDFLIKIPANIREKLIKRFNTAINSCVKEVLTP